MQSNVFRGTLPALMTPTTSDRKPDFDALVKKGRELVEIGMKGVIYCGSMGDWPLLSDEERMIGVEHLTKAGVPVVVGTGAQNTARAAALAAHAKKVGASGLMVIPRVMSRGSSQSAQKAHFEAVLEAGVDLPSVIYNSPYYGYETKADLFFELCKKHKHLVGFKEFGGAQSLRYAAEHIVGRDKHLMLLVGVDTQVVHGFVNCGAVGAITGIGNVLPREILTLVKLCEAAATGDVVARKRAHELDSALAVLSSFDEGPDLVLYYKYMMHLKGNAGYEHHFNASDVLSRPQREYAQSQLKLFETWYGAWSKETRP
jgi:1-pyrroline-4-hydroxy-2-carboxylate deaminase